MTMTRDGTGQRISSPNFVDIKTPHNAGVATSREPTPPSNRIGSMQDSKHVTTTPAGGGARPEHVMEWTM